MYIFVPILVFLVPQICASNILVIIPTPSFSHQTALRPIWKELSLRGHQVTVATTDPIKDPTLTNLKEIDMHETYNDPLMKDIYLAMCGATNLKLLALINEFVDVTLEFQLNNYFKDFIKKENTFDLLIVEYIYPEYLALSSIYNCPTILISSFDVTSLIHGYFGNPTNAIAYPDYFLPTIGGRLTLTERIINFLSTNLYYFFKAFISYPKRDKIIKDYFGNNISSLQKLFDDVDLLMLDINPVVNDIRPLGPNTIAFGGGNHILPPKPLPNDLQNFLDNAKEGCIYFNLGSNSKSVHIGAEKLQILMEALEELPYKILWKFESEDMVNPPKNIKLMSWVPQQDVLRHPNVVLFITQGGKQSLEEAILSHVPIAIMPMFGDQSSNAKRMEKKGFGKIIPHRPLPNKEEFKSIIVKVIKNPKYKKNIIKAAELLLDNQTGGIEKAVWWIEYVIRHKGAKHLKNPVVDVPFYQYYYLDVIFILICIVYISVKIVCFLISWIGIQIMQLINRRFCQMASNKNRRKKKD